MQRFSGDPRRQGLTRREALFFALGMIAMGIFLIVAFEREWPTYAFLPFTLALWVFWGIGFRPRTRRLMEKYPRIRSIYTLGTIAMVAILTVGTLLEWPLLAIVAVVVAVGALMQIAYRRITR